jgi:hypothetical protein
MERRAFLAAAAATPAGLVSARAAQYDGLPDDVGAALARFRNSIPNNSTAITWNMPSSRFS